VAGPGAASAGAARKPTDRAPALTTATAAVAMRRVGEGLMVPLGEVGEGSAWGCAV
jgi:hypothetical protein